MLAAHPYSSPVARFSFPLVFFPIYRLRASRSSSRSSSRHAVSFRAIRCVVLPVVSSARLVSPVGSSHLSFRLSSRSAPFRSAVRSFSFRLSWRSCLAFSSRLVFALAFRLVIASCPCVSSVHLVLSRHLVSVSPVGVSCSFSCLVPVFAPFRPARRSFLFAYSVSVHVLGRGAGPCRLWPWGGWGLLLSSHPFARCGMALWKDVAWGAVPCCSPLVPCLLMPHRYPHLIGSLALIAFSYPLIHEARKPGGGDG